jgi:bacterioferritin-associated ferredoxin
MVYIMNRKRQTKTPISRRQLASDTEATQKRGFGELAPSQLGLDMPDWMAPTPLSPEAQPPSTLQAGEEAAQLPTAGTPHTPEADSQARTLIEGMKVVCICKGIKKKVFWKALDDGMRTRDDINRSTGSGSGSCQGRRCGPRIVEMLRRLSQ